jgi:hypothetical protein
MKWLKAGRGNGEKLVDPPVCLGDHAALCFAGVCDFSRFGAFREEHLATFKNPNFCLKRQN